ncbi:hypothetical protein GEU84_003335 [Fertoebacter nigrum]|uniref:Uncharacterized protein n=1 Tax=Fertoeibacter niger TaxID=2656921 RepID=A0A8X8GUL9_9RHOB|nr:hypothetical protein [Fertoeibacter niger]NUB43407.1 hypothetical protein [Fertoeibacter niger]
MRRRLADLLPTAASLQRRAPAIAGFVFGAALQLVAAGMAMAITSGGLSDNPAPRASVYFQF